MAGTQSEKSRKADFKMAICNRGEVAVRIIHACRELGIQTVLLHSEADVNTIAYRLADERVCIGPASTRESYLNIENNIKGALQAKATAIHPGFGFLSENAEFARACADNKIKFVGPSPQAIRRMGDKVEAKKLAEELKLPTVPGYRGEDQSLPTLLKEAERIGFPVMVKARAGGGGRGMKILRSKNEAKALIESAQREALSSFGSGDVFLEKYLDHAKHIEVQIFGLSTGEVLALYERECTVQRRQQKIIEEAVSPSLSPELREKILATAIKLGEAAHYQNAGTVEFLVQDNHFYFMEINTRLQVEHPVTEEVLGVDLVKAQIFQARGLDQTLHWKKGGFTPRGHAIECRLYAEDPYQGGLPSTGKLGTVIWPHAMGRRFEVGFEAGDEITPFYDPMIAKIIVRDETRERAIAKMIQTLRETVVFGVKTNIPYLIAILSHPEFASAQMTTRFLETHFPDGLTEPPFLAEEKLFAEKALKSLARHGTSSGQLQTTVADPWHYQWGS